MSTLSCDCSLEALGTDFKFMAQNIFIVNISHFGLIIVGFCFMLNKMKVKLKAIVSDYSLLWKTIFYLRFLGEVDISIQFYLHLQGKM